MIQQITHVVDGQIVDQYQPSANPLACFIGMAEETIANLAFPPHYRITHNTAGQIDAAGTGELKFLLDNLANHEEITQIKAFSESAPLGENTYIELKPLN